MAVIKSNDKEFKEILTSGDPIVVKFYAGWCGTCKLIKPKFEKLSEDDRFNAIKFVDIDAESNPKIRDAVGVENLPYFAVFDNAEIVSKSGTSKMDGIVELLEKLNGR